MPRREAYFILVFEVIELVVMLFAGMLLPIQIFVLDDPVSPYKPCYTLWGYKARCDKLGYNAVGVAAFGCKKRSNLMFIAAMGAVAAVVGTLVLVILGIACICKGIRSFWALVIGSVLVVGFQSLCFSCLHSVYSKELCGDDQGVGTKLKDFTTLGVAYYFVLIALSVQGLNAIYAIFLLLFL